MAGSKSERGVNKEHWVGTEQSEREERRREGKEKREGGVLRTRAMFSSSYEGFLWGS